MIEFEMLTDEIRKFARARDWDRFHSSKNLAMAVAGEADKSCAEFQWLTSDQSERTSLSPDKLKSIGLEIADVQICLLRLADVLSIDIPALVLEKWRSMNRDSLGSCRTLLITAVTMPKISRLSASIGAKESKLP